MDSMIRPTRLLQRVSTRALTPRTAIFLAAIMNFIGALTFTGVAGTITKDIVDPFKLHNGLVVVLAAILAKNHLEFINMVLWYSKFIISRINRFNRCGDCDKDLVYFTIKVLLRLLLF